MQTIQTFLINKPIGVKKFGANEKNQCLFLSLRCQQKSMKDISVSIQRLYNHQSFKTVLEQQSTERAA